MRVLLGVSDHDRSLPALDRTLDRIREGDSLTVAVVARSEGGRVPESAVETVRDRLEAAGVDADVQRLAGDPGSRLVDRADAGDYDRLVIPGSEESPMGKIELDHLEQYVLLNCPTSVTILR